MTKAKVDLDQVYYAKGKTEQRRGRKLMYVNERKHFRRSSPMRAPGHEDVEAPRVCSLGCKAKVNGHHCRRRTCMDYVYCYQHLISKRHLFIAPSRHLRLMGVPGNPLGLYAVAGIRQLRLAGKDAYGAPRMTDELVFKKDAQIGSYGGEILPNKNERYADPEDKETATYAVEIADGTIFDGLTASGALSYSNDAINVKKIMTKYPTEKAFVRAYKTEEKAAKRDIVNIAVSDTQDKSVRFKTTRAVTHGTELLWTYGSLYWSTPGMKYYITGKGWH